MAARLGEPGNYPAVALRLCIVRIPTGSRQEVRILTGSSGSEFWHAVRKLAGSLLEIAGEVGL
jgi:hypothetical protein